MARVVDKTLVRKGATALPGEQGNAGWGWMHNLSDIFEHYSAGSILSRTQWKIALFFVATGIVLLLWAQNRDRVLALFDHEISRIEIRGQFEHMSQGALQAFLNKELGKSFLFTDLGAIKSSLLSLPWVHRATVSRVWPGELLIHFEEQVPVAYWNSDGLVNGDGKVFRPVQMDRSLRLPHFYGAESDDQVVTGKIMSMFESLKKQTASYGLVPESLKYDPRGAWELTLQNGIQVILGHEPLDKKISRVSRALTTEFSGREVGIERIDARYPNGLAVRWKQDKKQQNGN